ncbi:MAG: transcriptional regulator TetR family [Pseudomonas sp.]|nr:transcriptional regulator TetR family [Pseudomonas sp.]
MRKTRQETAATRQRIIAAAQTEFRRHGIEGSGLTGLMAAAGMTQGGFYKHFASKAQLVAESTTASVEALVDELESLPAEPGVAGAFKTMVNGYLSQSHRESDKGCPYAGLGSELSRGDDDVRNAAVAGFERMIEALSKPLVEATQTAARDQALLTMCAMMGALTVSRMAVGQPLSDEVLEAVRRQLLGRMADAR